MGVAQNWAERKGFEDYIELSKRLPDEYKVVMIGLTEEQKKKIPDNILGIKRTTSVEELVKWYSAADVFVNTTYEDTFPTVNIEAQACGTPAITYKTGGSPESVLAENVAEQGDIEGLVSKIKEICEKNDRHVFFCDTQKYDRNILYKKYIDLYFGNKLCEQCREE